MTKLAELLNASEPTFSLAIRDLEKITGRKATDLLLLDEMRQKAYNRMHRLGLDHKDTTARELYHALEIKIAEDNLRLAKIIGGSDDSNIKELVPLMIKAAKTADIPMQTWALKRSVAKDMLREMLPKNMMEHLGYRSINSLLKREPFDEIYTALRFTEGDEWLSEYNELFKKVRASDFEQRKISIIEMNHDKWVDEAGKFTKKKLHNVTHTKEMGTIVVVPMHVDKMRGLPLKTMALIFHYINEVRLYSAFFKLKSTHKNFGAEVVETLNADPSTAAVVGHQHVHWRVIQRYFGKLKSEDHPEAFEPHVHPEDLHWRRAEEVLIDIDPELEFWRSLDYVIHDLGNSQHISLNLTDVSFGYSNEVAFKDRYVYHARESLWNEIFMRYLGKSNLEDQILNQLDNDMIAPEVLDLVGSKKKGNR
ncbi:hypothetical protein KBB17_01565 [Candidatus Saccharibacteria bacterium]|jgi:hypothetical protein|nr:hypothetical protein [Candidatus Saccharibacteria bacterium]